MIILLMPLELFLTGYTMDCWRAGNIIYWAITITSTLATVSC